MKLKSLNLSFFLVFILLLIMPVLAVAENFYIHEWGHDDASGNDYTCQKIVTFDDSGEFKSENIIHSECNNYKTKTGPYTVTGTYTVSNGILSFSEVAFDANDIQCLSDFAKAKIQISPNGEIFAGVTAESSGVNNEILRIGVKESSISNINGTYYIYGWGHYDDGTNYTCTYRDEIIFDGSDGYTAKQKIHSEGDDYGIKTGTYTVSDGILSFSEVAFDANNIQCLSDFAKAKIRISPNGEIFAGITAESEEPYENLIIGVKESSLSNINGTYYFYGWGHDDDSNNYTCTYINKTIFDGSGKYTSENIIDSEGDDYGTKTGTYTVSNGILSFLESPYNRISPNGEIFAGITAEPDGEDLRIGVRYYVEKDFNLPKGWSMISLPVTPSEPTLSALFPGAAVLYRFEKGAGYVRVQANEALQVGDGYWILVYEDQNYVLTGQPITSYSKTVYSDGWEMIGGCTYGARPIADSCSIDVIYRFDQGMGYQRVEQGENLQHGKGYWILLKEVVDQCELTIGLPFTGTFKYEETYEANYCKSGGVPYSCTVNDWNIIYLKQDGNSITGNVFEIDTVENCCTATSTVPITGTINGTTATLSAPAGEMKCEGKCNGGENCIYEHEENYNSGPQTVTATLKYNGNILHIIHDGEVTASDRQPKGGQIIDVAGTWNWIEEQYEVFGDPNGCHEIGYKETFTVTITQNEDQLTFFFDIEDVEDITEYSITGSITGNIISANGTIQLEGDVNLEFTVILAVSDDGQTLTGILSQDNNGSDYCTGTFEISATKSS